MSAPAKREEDEPTFERLKVELSGEEISRMGQQMARKLEEGAQIQSQLESHTKTEKGKLAKIKTDVAELSQAINRGYEYRDVEVRQRKDFELGSVITYRVDTLEEVSSRSMTEKERQPDLFEQAETVSAESETAESAAELLVEREAKIKGVITELLDTASLSNAWGALRKHGATDLEIQKELSADIGKKGRVGSTNGLSYIAAKPEPALWVGSRGGQGIEPTLKGAELLARIREVFEIPQPEPIEKAEEGAAPLPFYRKKRDRKKIGAEAGQ